MSNILNLVSEDEEASLNAFIDKGIVRIKTNRKFCGLCWSEFVAFLCEGDLSSGLVDGALRLLATMPFTYGENNPQEHTLEAYQEFLNEYLEKYIESNKQQVVRGYREHMNSMRMQRLIDQHHFPKTSNF